MSVFRPAFIVGAVVCLPFLGSVGLWDPWETHYAEVGRQMLARADLIHPYWEHAYFFSKPPLVPWLAALGLFVSGAQPWGASGVGALPSHVEWFIRLPIAVLMVLAGALFADTVARYTSRRVGLLTAVVWWTMPLVCFMSRQAMTDGPFVSCLMVSVACALRAGLEERPAGWWAGAFASVGVALLAKGLLGFLPVVLLPLAWALLDRKTALARLKAVPSWGLPLSLAVGAPWYVAMAFFPERDEEGRLFVERFFGYDHFDRLVSGVHTTTPGGTFAYFLEQGAYAVAPWVVLIPFALWEAAKVADARRRQLTLTMGTVSLVTFALFSASATRYHHYILPSLPGLAVLLALGLDTLLSEGLSRNRPALLVGAVFQALVCKDLWQRPRHLVDLFTYNQERPYPDDALLGPVSFKWAMLVLGALAGAAVVVALVRQQRSLLAGAIVSWSAMLALFVSWHHWTALGGHWTQRELISQYHAVKKPGDALGAFLMNWKGETFYTRNEVLQLKSGDPRGELAAFTQRPGGGFLVVESARLGLLRSLLPQKNLEILKTTNKFVLVSF